MNGYATLEQPGQNGGDIGRAAFIIKMILAKTVKVHLVQVQAVYTSTGAISTYTVVDALPLVDQVDGEGNGTPRGLLTNIPVWSMQGGLSMATCNPQIGDIGLCLFCDRDISGIKTSQTFSIPAFDGYHQWSDGIYFGGVLNATPTQTLVLDDISGISMTSPVAVNVTAPSITLTGVVNAVGDLQKNGVSVIAP